jgi:hypothetical protein
VVLERKRWANSTPEETPEETGVQRPKRALNHYSTLKYIL